MGTFLTLLLAVPLVGWLAAVVIGTHRRERRRLADLESGAAAYGWTYTPDSARLDPPQLREWRRRIRFLEGFSGSQDGQDFAVAHIVHESSDADADGRRVHSTICWLHLLFPLEDVRIVPAERVDELRALVGGEEFRTGHADFDERYRILATNELVGRRAAGPAVRTLLLAHRVPWRVTVQGMTVVAERTDRVPRNVEDGLNGVAVISAVAASLTGWGLR